MTRGTNIKSNGAAGKYLIFPTPQYFANPRERTNQTRQPRAITHHRQDSWTDMGAVTPESIALAIVSEIDAGLAGRRPKL
jgi:hypothetical protein